MNELVFVAAKSGKPYESVYMDTKHLVVPVVLLVEGVIRPGNIGRDELCLATEFSKVPEAWDGRPVVLDHPQGASANTPLNLEEKSFGLLFNTEADGKKLKSEAWINLDRVENLGGDIKELVELIQNGSAVEISTGLFSFTEDKKGVFNGRDFDGIWRSIVPDHLAMLPKGVVGACSLDMGCGANRKNSQAADYMDDELHARYHAVQNKLPSPHKGEAQKDFHSRCMGDKTTAKEFPDQKQRNAICYSQWRRRKRNAEQENTMHEHDDCTCGGMCDECSARANATDPKKPYGDVSYADPGYQADGKSRYPLDTEAHIRAAWNYINKKKNAGKYSSDQLSKIKTKIIAAWKAKIDKAGPPSASKSAARAVTDFVAVMLSDAQFSYRKNVSISDTDLRASLTAAINDYFEDETTGGYYYYYIVAVFDNVVVYATYNGLFACAYTMDDSDGSTDLTGEPYEVRPMTQFVPVSDPDENDESAAEDVQTQQNSAGSEERAMNEQEKAAAEQAAREARQKEINDAVATAISNYDAEQLKKAPKTFDEYVAAAPEGVREQLVEGNRILLARKNSLVTQLSTHKSKAYSKEELEKMSVEQLEKIARIANVATSEGVDFSGRPMPALSQQNSEAPTSLDEEMAPAPLRVFNYGATHVKTDKEKKEDAETQTQ